jgi:hypothetical protein
VFGAVDILEFGDSGGAGCGVDGHGRCHGLIPTIMALRRLPSIRIA